jgi:hypothetical protein
MKFVEKLALKADLEVSTVDSPPSPPITASLLMLKSPVYSESGRSESSSARKRPSPSSPDEATPIAQRSRSVLQPINNEPKVQSPAVESRPPSLGRTLSCDTPCSFVGSPVKKKRRLSSIKRL